MHKFIILSCLFFSYLHSNELIFKEIKERDDKSVEISFLLEKVALIKSYSLNNPSRLVFDIYDCDLKEIIDEPYNYPIKKIRASSKDDLTRVVIDLYEYVNWSKPTQEKIDEGILLKIKRQKK